MTSDEMKLRVLSPGTISLSRQSGQSIAQRIAEELCSVQPIDIDFKALMDDPLAQMLSTRFAERLQGDKE